MSDVQGKTIAWVDDYGDTLHFTDGTALRITSDDGHYIKLLDWKAVQARLHAVQGRREQDRMRRLEAALHPRDRQLLAERRRLAQERANEEWERTATPMQRAFRQIMGGALLDMQADSNRGSFWTDSAAPPRKRKARRS